MSKKIIILTIPGIGTKEEGYAARFEKDVRKFTNDEVQNNLQVLEARPFGVTDIDENQRKLFERLDDKNRLGGVLSLRKFVLEAFGDGVTFERDASNPKSNYRKVHNYLKGEIENVNALLNEEDVFVILAASMGVHVLSTYITDADNNKGIFENSPATTNQNLRNLDYLATIGCNIPLFMSGLREDQIVAFDKRNDHFTWDNYYDRDDVLGWPLQQMSASYDKLVTDHEVNIGLYAGSHAKYWNDNSFTKLFSKKLNELYR